jgi:hypothetical protein
MDAAEAMEVLEQMRAEEERQLESWLHSSARTLVLPPARAVVDDRFDRRLTALALALDALRRGRR